MKITVFSSFPVTLGRHNIRDSRLDEIDRIVQTKKKTYIQAELAGPDAALEADVILALADERADLILKDLEFVEARLGRATEGQEKALLNKLKGILEKEEFIVQAGLSAEEKHLISAYGLLTGRPIIIAENKEWEDLDRLLARAVAESGYVSFFTTGEKETRAWLLKKGATAWEAAGAIHSDMQRGFIRAEVISFSDFARAGSEAQAKQSGRMHLEQKDYIVQDGDILNIRFNK